MPISQAHCCTFIGLVRPKVSTVSTVLVSRGSGRRKAQLIAARPGLNIVDLRGNVGTRVQRVTDGDLDAAILACAGLERIGLTDVIAEVLAPEVMLPAAGQGALGIQTRADDAGLRVGPAA